MLIAYFWRSIVFEINGFWGFSRSVQLLLEISFLWGSWPWQLLSFIFFTWWSFFKPFCGPFQWLCWLGVFRWVQWVFPFACWVRFVTDWLSRIFKRPCTGRKRRTLVRRNWLWRLNEWFWRFCRCCFNRPKGQSWRQPDRTIPWWFCLQWAKTEWGTFSWLEWQYHTWSGRTQTWYKYQSIIWTFKFQGTLTGFTWWVAVGCSTWCFGRCKYWWGFGWDSWWTRLGSWFITATAGWGRRRIARLTARLSLGLLVSFFPLALMRLRPLTTLALWTRILLRLYFTLLNVLNWSLNRGSPHCSLTEFGSFPPLHRPSQSIPPFRQFADSSSSDCPNSNFSFSSKQQTSQVQIHVVAGFQSGWFPDWFCSTGRSSSIAPGSEFMFWTSNHCYSYEASCHQLHLTLCFLVFCASRLVLLNSAIMDLACPFLLTWIKRSFLLSGSLGLCVIWWGWIICGLFFDELISKNRQISLIRRSRRLSRRMGTRRELFRKHPLGWWVVFRFVVSFCQGFKLGQIFWYLRVPWTFFDRRLRCIFVVWGRAFWLFWGINHQWVWWDQRDQDLRTRHFNLWRCCCTGWQWCRRGESFARLGGQHWRGVFQTRVLWVIRRFIVWWHTTRRSA